MTEIIIDIEKDSREQLKDVVNQINKELQKRGPEPGCMTCKFTIQTNSSVVCGHRDANANTRGRYTYPPMNFPCDINKYEKGEPGNSNRDNDALVGEHGWELERVSGGVKYYKKIEMLSGICGPVIVRAV